MGKNRDRVSIVAAVLDAVGAGSVKTRIMFAANLNYRLLEKYLAASLDLGFVQANGGTYSLTSHGHEFLQQYKRFQLKYSRVQKTLRSLAEERGLLKRQCQNTLVAIDNRFVG